MLARDSERILVHVDVGVLHGEPEQLERRRHDAVRSIFVHVHPVRPSVVGFAERGESS